MFYLLLFAFASVQNTSQPLPIYTCYASTLVRGSQLYEASDRFHSVASREALELCRQNNTEETCYISHCDPLVE